MIIPPPPPASEPDPDDPQLAAWVRASTDGLPDGENLPQVDPATLALMEAAVADFAAAMDRGDEDHGEGRVVSG